MPEPTEAQIAMLQSLPAQEPVAALNLFQFHDRASYSPDDPEYGTADADITGREAYAKYATIAGKSISAIGGRVVFSTAVDQVMIGASDPKWDVSAIMYFPTRAAFMEMLTNPEFQSASRHRKAALENHYMVHLKGDPF